MFIPLNRHSEFGICKWSYSSLQSIIYHLNWFIVAKKVNDSITGASHDNTHPQATEKINTSFFLTMILQLKLYVFRVSTFVERLSGHSGADQS